MQFNNFAQYVLDTLEHNKDKKNAIIVDEKDTITFSEIPPTVRRFAYKLKHTYHIARGDVIAISMEDSTDWIIAFLAILYVGGTPVLINPWLPSQSIKDTITSVNPRALILDFQIAINNLQQISKKEISEVGPELIAWHKFAPDDISLWVCSSGTTGKRQKIILHRHSSFYASAKFSIPGHRISQDSVVYSTLKMTYHPGTLTAMHSLLAGATLIATAKVPSPPVVNKIVNRCSVTHMFTIPSILSSMVTHPQPYTMESIKWLIASGEPLLKVVEDKFTEIYKCIVLNSHGCGETLGHTGSQTPENKIAGSIGNPFTGVIYQVRDANGEVLHDAGNEGELFICTPTIAVLYLDMEEETAATFINGWLRTKDIVTISDTGELIYKCRSDDYVKINSCYVSLLEVEEEILKFVDIDECVVTVYIDNHNKLKLHALIEGSNTLNKNEIRRFLKANNVHTHKIPRRISIVPKIPRTVTQKKLRNPDRLAIFN